MANEKLRSVVEEMQSQLGRGVAAGADRPLAGIPSATEPLCTDAGTEVLEPVAEQPTSDATLLERRQLERDLSALRTEIENLKSENARLKNENQNLREKLNFFELCHRLAIGTKGEFIIARMINAERIEDNKGHDLETHDVQGSIRLEVKYSRLGKEKGKRTKRWRWNSIFGAKGTKEYERLILVGENVDDDHKEKYKAKQSPYILFDIPAGEVDALTQDGGNRGRMIRPCSNPEAKDAARSRILYDKYEVTHAKFAYRYDNLKQVDKTCQNGDGRESRT